MYRIFILLSVLLLSACNQVNPQQMLILDQQLKTALQNKQNTLTEMRTPIMFEGEKTVNTCQDYQQLIHNTALIETVNNQLIKSEYLTCEALDLLANASTIDTLISTQLLGNQLLSKLDIRSFSSSLNMMADQDKHTLKQLYPDLAKTDKTSATVEDGEINYSLNIVAIVDIDHNQQADWVVQLVDESKLANYRYYGTLVIYNPDNKDNLEAIQYPEMH